MALRLVPVSRFIGWNISGRNASGHRDGFDALRALQRLPAAVQQLAQGNDVVQRRDRALGR